MSEAAYKPVPVVVAQAIGSEFEKCAVVVAAFDDVHSLFHFTTWGRAPRAKSLAAELANRISAVCSDSSAKREFENFETTPAAVAAATIERLKRERDAALSVCDGLVALCEDEFFDPQEMSPECTRLYNEARRVMASTEPQISPVTDSQCPSNEDGTDDSDASARASA